MKILEVIVGKGEKKLLRREAVHFYCTTLLLSIEFPSKEICDRVLNFFFLFRLNRGIVAIEKGEKKLSERIVRKKEI